MPVSLNFRSSFLDKYEPRFLESEEERQLRATLAGKGTSASEVGRISLPRLKEEAVPDPSESTDPEDRDWSQLSGRDKMLRVAFALTQALATYASANPGETAARLTQDMIEAKAARRTKREQAAEDAKRRNAQVQNTNAELAARETEINESRSDRARERSEDRRYSVEDREDSQEAQLERDRQNDAATSARLEREYVLRQQADAQAAARATEERMRADLAGLVRPDLAQGIARRFAAGQTTDTDEATLELLRLRESRLDDVQLLDAFSQIAQRRIGPPAVNPMTGEMESTPLGLNGLLGMFTPEGEQPSLDRVLSLFRGQETQLPGSNANGNAVVDASTVRVQSALAGMQDLLAKGVPMATIAADLETEQSLSRKEKDQVLGLMQAQLEQQMMARAGASLGAQEPNAVNRFAASQRQPQQRPTQLRPFSRPQPPKQQPPQNPLDLSHLLKPRR